MPRWLEIALVVIMAPLLLALSAPAALAVLVSLGRPVLFRQERLGRSGETITMSKFRTMTNDRAGDGELLPDSDRVSRVGTVLRRYRLDELPSFLNVLDGSLALVGPRPLPANFYDELPHAKERLNVRPGFSGLAQVSGNTKLQPAEKLAVDLFYISKRSCRFDFKILFQTISTLTKGERRNEELIADALGVQAASETAR